MFPFAVFVMPPSAPYIECCLIGRPDDFSVKPKHVVIVLFLLNRLCGLKQTASNCSTDLYPMGLPKRKYNILMGNVGSS